MTVPDPITAARTQPVESVRTFPDDLGQTLTLTLIGHADVM